MMYMQWNIQLDIDYGDALMVNVRIAHLRIVGDEVWWWLGWFTSMENIQLEIYMIYMKNIHQLEMKREKKSRVIMSKLAQHKEEVRTK